MKKVNKVMMALLTVLLLVTFVACNPALDSGNQNSGKPDSGKQEIVLAEPKITSIADISKAIPGDEIKLESKTQEDKYAKIYYTLDGSEPTNKESLTCKEYKWKNPPVFKGEDMTLKAKAYYDGYKASKTAVFEIKIDPNFRYPVVAYSDAEMTKELGISNVGTLGVNPVIYLKSEDTHKGDIYYSLDDAAEQKYDASKGIEITAPTVAPDEGDLIHSIKAYFKETDELKSVEKTYSFAWLGSNALFFTQYYEGADNYKFAVITNTSDRSIDLGGAGYVYKSSVNGGDPESVELSGLLAPHKSIVLHSNQFGLTEPEFKSIADLPEFDAKNVENTNDKSYRISSKFAAWNGDDTAELWRVDGKVDEVILKAGEKYPRENHIGIRLYEATPTSETPWTFTSYKNVKYNDLSLIDNYTAAKAAEFVTDFFINEQKLTDNQSITLGKTGSELTWLSMSANVTDEKGDIANCGDIKIDSTTTIKLKIGDKLNTFPFIVKLRNISYNHAPENWDCNGIGTNLDNAYEVGLPTKKNTITELGTAATFKGMVIGFEWGGNAIVVMDKDHIAYVGDAKLCEGGITSLKDLKVGDEVEVTCNTVKKINGNADQGLIYLIGNNKSETSVNTVKRIKESDVKQHTFYADPITKQSEYDAIDGINKTKFVALTVKVAEDYTGNKPTFNVQLTNADNQPVEVSLNSFSKAGNLNIPAGDYEIYGVIANNYGKRQIVIYDEDAIVKIIK